MGAGFIWFFVPETKNLTLEEMDEVFGDEAGNAMADRQRMDRIYVELGLIGGSMSNDAHEKNVVFSKSE